MEWLGRAGVVAERGSPAGGVGAEEELEQSLTRQWGGSEKGARQGPEPGAFESGPFRFCLKGLEDGIGRGSSPGVQTALGTPFALSGGPPVRPEDRSSLRALAVLGGTVVLASGRCRCETHEEFRLALLAGL